MQTIKTTLFTDWHWARLIRLGLGLFIAIQAIRTHDSLSGFLAAFLFFQALSNTGCCGANGCVVPTTRSKQDGIADVEFEEVKGK
jgi:hypothetical protein